MMIGGESFINEELSALRIAVFVIIQLYITRMLPKSRNLSILLAQLIDGKPIVHAKSLVLIPTLSSLCQVIAESYKKSHIPGNSKDNSDSNSELVDEILFRILDTLWKLETADDLHHLVRETYESIEATQKVTSTREFKVSFRSPIGRYVQKIAVSVRLLHFNETTVLFNCVRQFREPSLGLYKNLQKLEFSNHKLSSNNEERHVNQLFRTWTSLARSDFKSRQNKHEHDDEGLYQILGSYAQSVHSASAVPKSTINLQCTHSDFESLVDTQITLLERYGTPTPESLRSAFRCMASRSVKSRIADSMDYTSTSSVHYLNYLEHLNSGDYHEAFNSLHQYFDYMVSKGSKYFYHFALISKASLHQFFGEDRKALDSIEEAISIARENKDNATLTYVLSWLFDFMRKKPSLWDNQSFHQIRSQSRLLDFLIKKSQAVSLSLAAITFRFEAELLMNSKGSFLQYYESLFKATYISMHDSVASFIGLCHTSSVLWRNVGIYSLSTLYTELGILYSRRHGSPQDHLEFQLQKCYDLYSSGCQSTIMADLNSHLSSGYNNGTQFRFLRYKILIARAEIELNKGRVRMASELLSSVPESCELEPDFVVSRLSLAAKILVAQGNFSRALVILKSPKFDIPPQDHSLCQNIIHVIKLNFLRAHVLIAGGSPHRAFSLVIQHLESAKLRGFKSLVAEGFLLLLKILNDTNNTRDAYSVAIIAIPVATCVKDLNLTSSLLFQAAKSCCSILELGCSSCKAQNVFEQLLHFLSLSILGFKNMRNLYMLNQCFTLEDRVSSISSLSSDIRSTTAFGEFRTHSTKGLDVTAKKLDAEHSYGYLKRATSDN